MDTNRTTIDPAGRLRHAGLRPTRQRVALADLLFAKGDRHLTAEELHEEAETAGGATPTLILTRANTGQGGFDGLWLSQQAKLVQRWPAARLAAAPKGGHYVHRDARDWFVSEVSGFLTALGQP